MSRSEGTGKEEEGVDEVHCVLCGSMVRRVLDMFCRVGEKRVFDEYVELMSWNAGCEADA